jgi:hypothetical protein
MTEFLKQVPRPQRILGLAGLLPFWLPVLLSFEPEISIASLLTAQKLYAAVILSFLGGVHWGVTVADSRLSTWARRLERDAFSDWLDWCAAVGRAGDHGARAGFCGRCGRGLGHPFRPGSMVPPPAHGVERGSNRGAAGQPRWPAGLGSATACSNVRYWRKADRSVERR